MIPGKHRRLTMMNPLTKSLISEQDEEDLKHEIVAEDD